MTLKCLPTTIKCLKLNDTQMPSLLELIKCHMKLIYGDEYKENCMTFSTAFLKICHGHFLAESIVHQINSMAAFRPLGAFDQCCENVEFVKSTKTLTNLMTGKKVNVDKLLQHTKILRKSKPA